MRFFVILSSLKFNFGILFARIHDKDDIPLQKYQKNVYTQGFNGYAILLKKHKLNKGGALMKQSQTFIPTMREMPRNVHTNSCQMLLRAGFIRQYSNGTYSYLPLAKRVLKKIEQIIREEIEKRDAIEVELPCIQSIDFYKQTGRLEEDLIHFQDDFDREFVIGPSMDLMTSIVRDEIKTYKKLPITLYQMQKRLQNIKESRLDLFQARESCILNAYSFHESEESLTQAFADMIQTYERIFSRLGLTVQMAETDAGPFGKESYEFVVFTTIGDETIACSDQSKYAANAEIAKVSMEYEHSAEEMKPLKKIETPNVQTIQELCDELHIEPNQCIKSLVLNIDGEIVVALVRGDHQLNLRKVKKVLKASDIRLANEEEIKNHLGCAKGSIGPIKLPINIKVIADHGIQWMVNAVTGANEDGYHYINVNPNRDFAINLYEDIRYIEEGDPSPDGQGTLLLKKGIVVGRATKLAPHYAEKMSAYVVNNEGAQIPLQIASYEVELTRLFAILAEQYQDDRGFTWPKHLAPYDLHLMAINVNDEVQYNLVEQLYNILTTYRYNVLYDNRDERAGVKFADSDLIGLPIRVTVGKKAIEGIVEVKNRKTGETIECMKEELIDYLNEFYRTQ